MEKTKALAPLIFTLKLDTRFIGDSIIYNEDFDETYVGFENHSGRTYTNGLKPLGKCLHGYGNNGEDHKRGVSIKIHIAPIFIHCFLKSRISR